MTGINRPVSGSGPDATLNLKDPSTLIATALSVLAAVVTALNQAYPQWNLANLRDILVAIAGLNIPVVIHSKHLLAASVAAPVPVASQVFPEVLSTPLTSASQLAWSAPPAPVAPLQPTQEMVDKTVAASVDIIRGMLDKGLPAE